MDQFTQILPAQFLARAPKPGRSKNPAGADISFPCSPPFALDCLGIFSDISTDKSSPQPEKCLPDRRRDGLVDVRSRRDPKGSQESIPNPIMRMENRIEKGRKP